MKQFKFNITAQTNELDGSIESVASNTLKYAKCKFTFLVDTSGDEPDYPWDNIEHLSAIFKNTNPEGDDPIEKAMLLTAIPDKEREFQCDIPHEIFDAKGTVMVHLVGFNDEDVDDEDVITYRMTSFDVKFAKIIKVTTEATAEAEVTPSLFEQYCSLVEAEVAKVTGMTVSATTLPAGSSATATKTEVGGVVNIAYGIPTGATGNGISSITKTATVGLVDTYTITFTNGATTTFDITNGEDGDVTTEQMNAAISTALASYRTSSAQDVIDNKQDRSLDMLWKLNKGQTWDFDVDTDTLYTKTVPSGAKYDSVDVVGGNSRVFNQLIGTLDYSTTLRQALTLGTKIISGHKYYLSVDYSGSSTTQECCIYTMSSGTNTLVMKVNGNETAKAFTATVSGTSDGTNNQTEGNIWVWISEANTFSNFRVVDLTQWFGSGNEPSSISDPKMDEVYAWLATNPPYNTGEIKSASVDEVEVVGFNMFNPSKSFTNIVGSKPNVYSYSVDSNSEITFTAQYYDRTANIFGIEVDTSGVDTIYLSLVGLTIISGSYIKLNVFDENGNTIYTANHNTSQLTSPAISVANYEKVYIQPDVMQWGGKFKFKLVVAASTTATFVPYLEKQSFNVPSAIQNLTGYGWSAGSVYNEVNYASKKYIQRVARLSLNVDDMNNSESYPGWKNSGVEEIIGHGVQTTEIAGAMFEHGAVVCANTNIYDVLYLGTATYGLTQTQWKQQYAGQTFHFYIPLAIPIETDISSLLTDGFLENFDVESGGTITYHNSNGDGYRLPVPATNEFIVKIDEVS